MEFFRTHLACGFPRAGAADLAKYCGHIAHGSLGQPLRGTGFRPMTHGTPLFKEPAGQYCSE